MRAVSRRWVTTPSAFARWPITAKVAVKNAVWVRSRGSRTSGESRKSAASSASRRSESAQPRSVRAERSRLCPSATPTSAPRGPPSAKPRAPPRIFPSQAIVFEGTFPVRADEPALHRKRPVRATRDSQPFAARVTACLSPRSVQGPRSAAGRSPRRSCAAWQTTAIPGRHGPATTAIRVCRGPHGTCRRMAGGMIHRGRGCFPGEDRSARLQDGTLTAIPSSVFRSGSRRDCGVSPVTRRPWSPAGNSRCEQPRDSP